MLPSGLHPPGCKISFQSLPQTSSSWAFGRSDWSRNDPPSSFTSGHASKGPAVAPDLVPTACAACAFDRLSVWMFHSSCLHDCKAFKSPRYLSTNRTWLHGSLLCHHLPYRQKAACRPSRRQYIYIYIINYIYIYIYIYILWYMYLYLYIYIIYPIEASYTWWFSQDFPNLFVFSFALGCPGGISRAALQPWSEVHGTGLGDHAWDHWDRDRRIFNGFYSYGHLPIITGYKWGYIFYKWGYKYL